MLHPFLTIQLISCAAMTGIIWMVQVAVYPLLARLEGKAFDDYHTRYMSQVTFVIAPFMFLEATTCAACLYFGNWQDFVIPTILLALVWASTAFIQVPNTQNSLRKMSPPSSAPTGSVALPGRLDSSSLPLRYDHVSAFSNGGTLTIFALR